MKSRKLLFVCLVLALVPMSCEDFLEKPPQGNLTQTNFPTTAQDALLATNAVYNTIRESNFNSGLFPILDIMSDDTNKGSNPDDASATIGPFDRFEHIKTEGAILRWWNTLYKAVRRANVVIEKVPLITMNETLRNRYVAEARFLRAFFYFDLVRAWGGVPKLVTVDPVVLPRSSVDEIYELIIDDLLFAVSNLPEKSEYTSVSDLGRATKGAAKSLLAKVYLFRGNFPAAATYALEVINSGEYNLEPDFEDANSVSGEHGIESVFEVAAFGAEGLANGGNQYGNVQGVRGNPNRGWGFNRPTKNLRDDFEPGDPRLQATVIFLGEVLDGVTILGDAATPDVSVDSHGQEEIECYNQKVWTPGVTVPPSFGHNRRFIRFADVLLIAAEALNENNNAAQALIHLNRVRQRARHGNPALLPDVTETNKDLLRNIILHERRVELALEGHRFWDLVRTNKAATVLGPLGFVAGKHELLPIPQTEIDLTQNALTQNPGWEN
ncbi:MAG: RagB/SusD family nutrient uptake outer membrane protein [Cyclobacteriaceae bacterium]|nr:RagB/SusD family nutrient uptake outer membrane protein [Cyclobacteriaceae bacterium]UYN86044.1 MAG: RagB/SusD family nutrient uptake outer membrane protein [Cyclobacteriaceae bacterium]